MPYTVTLTSTDPEQDDVVIENLGYVQAAMLAADASYVEDIDRIEITEPGTDHRLTLEATGDGGFEAAGSDGLSATVTADNDVIYHNNPSEEA